MRPFIQGSHIIFLCNGNITRSPMAAAIFAAKMAARKFECRVESAGVIPLGFSGGAARQWGFLREAEAYDLSAHRSRHIRSVPYTADTFFACMARSVHAHALRLPGITTENVIQFNPPDGVNNPSAGECTFNDCFVQIYAGTAKLIGRFGLDRA